MKYVTHSSSTHVVHCDQMVHFLFSKKGLTNQMPSQSPLPFPIPPMMDFYKYQIYTITKDKINITIINYDNLKIVNCRVIRNFTHFSGNDTEQNTSV